MIRAALLISAFMTVLPATATSQQVIGEITATLDGEERNWQTLGQGPDSYNTGLTDFGFGMYQVSIQGFAGERPQMAGTLQIVFGGMEGADAPDEIEIIYVPERMSQSYALPEDDAARAGALVIEEFDISGNEARVAGRIATELCFKDGMMASPDLADCIDIQGRFDTALPIEEF